MSLKRAKASAREHRLCWIWVEISHFFKYKNGELDLKTLLFDYWNDLVLRSVETCFLEVGGYMSLKRTIKGFWEGRFCWVCVKSPQFFKYKNGGVEPKNFIVSLLKLSSLRLITNIFSGCRWINVSETTHHRSLMEGYHQCWRDYKLPRDYRSFTWK